ncbi:Tetratricopeptide repeat-containing protein [Sinosporangium album]|uniref:Tetratricopeptide repeat-containing protein n=1 Tax=Sinosporangium album TaxID=504805 RepID=A0A1G8L5F1_9ACTN|nr:tetratricopeptide repeat protein [Sinosporangium album]SDI50430.1 Tetratricopeptide repeat-containing protein [Sinosporangium album]
MPSTVQPGEAYDALPEPHQRAYRTLGIHPGKHISAAAAAVVLDTPHEQAVTHLDALAAAGLLEECESGRYRFAAGAHDHALGMAEGYDSVRHRIRTLDRTIDWYLVKVLEADLTAMPDRLRTSPRYRRVERGAFDDAAAALDWVDHHLDVLHAQVIAAYENGMYEQVVAMAEGLRSVFLHRSHRRCTEVWHAATQMAVAAARMLGDRMLVGRMLTARASYLLHVGELARALTCSREATQAARKARDLPGEAAAAEIEGVVRLSLGEAAAAEARFRAACALFEEADDARGTALLNRRLAEVAVVQGDYDTALARFRTVRSLFTDLGDRYNLVRTGALVGAVHIRMNNPTAAKPELERALEIAEQITHTGIQADIHTSLALIATDEATAIYHQDKVVELLQWPHSPGPQAAQPAADPTGA